MDFDVDARIKICEFISTFIGTQPISIMTKRNIIPDPAPVVMYKDGDTTDYSTEDMAKTIANRGNDIFGGTKIIDKELTDAIEPETPWEIK